MAGRILVVEDSKEMQRVISECLRHFSLDACATLKDAEKALAKQSFDLILLDIGLPDGDGLRFFTKLKNSELSEVPVVFLTARSQTEDIVMAFNLGAEDYITKPFNLMEFRARIEAKLRSIEKNKNRDQTLHFGDLQLDLARHRVHFQSSAGAKSIDLTPLEFKILAFLARNDDLVFNREQLIEQVWGAGTEISDRVVDSHISRIRKKLKACEYSIESIYGTGYSFRKKSEAA